MANETRAEEEGKEMNMGCTVVLLPPPGPEFLPNPCDGIVPTFEVYVTFTGPTMVFYESRLPRSRRS